MLIFTASTEAWSNVKVSGGESGEVESSCFTGATWSCLMRDNRLGVWHDWIGIESSCKMFIH